MPRAATARAPDVAAPTKSQSQALEALAEQVGQLVESNRHLQDRLQAAEQRASNAEANAGIPPRRVAPVAPNTKMVDSGDLELGGDGDVVTMETERGTNRPYLKDRLIENPDIAGEKMIDAKWAENMRFNEERVIVLVHPEPDSKYPEPCISIWNDGRHQLFPRGMNITVARKFLEVLARAKPVRYDNVEYMDENGIRAVKYPRRVSHRFPFSVIRDDNPRGAAWLARICAEA